MENSLWKRLWTWYKTNWLMIWLNIHPFLGAFAKLRKVITSFVMSVCLSVCLSVRMEQLGSHRKEFYDISYEYFSKICRENSSLIKIIFMIISRSVLLEWECFSQIRTENQNTYLMHSNVFRQSCHLWDNVEKCYTAGQANSDNMAHANCTLGT
jgi:hypothetical protein